MKINKLIDSYEDDSFSLYYLQKESLLKGITLDFSFIGINPFNGINRKNHSIHLSDEAVDTGIYSFLFNSNLFSIVNPDANIVYFDRIVLFSDEQYEIKLMSGIYQTKEIVTKIGDLINSNFFEDDNLILNLMKYKNLKVSFKLKEAASFREKIEEKINLNNSEVHAENLLQKFVKRVSDRQLEKENYIYSYFSILKVNYNESDSKEDLIKKFKQLQLKDIKIKKDILYMNLLFNEVNSTVNDVKTDVEKIIDKAQLKYDRIKKDMKVLEYELQAKYITIKDNNSI